jgi:hypothetical protein
MHVEWTQASASRSWGYEEGMRFLQVIDNHQEKVKTTD